MSYRPSLGTRGELRRIAAEAETTTIERVRPWKRKVQPCRLAPHVIVPQWIRSSEAPPPLPPISSAAANIGASASATAAAAAAEAAGPGAAVNAIPAATESQRGPANVIATELVAAIFDDATASKRVSFARPGRRATTRSATAAGQEQSAADALANATSAATAQASQAGLSRMGH